MSFSNFMLYGVDKKNKRETYPADKVEAKGLSSGRYEGIVTKVETVAKKKITEIDDTVKYETVSDAISNQAKDDLFDHGKKAAITGIVGTGGLGYSIYNIINGYTKSGITGATMSLGLSLLSIYRVNEAYEESQNWEDQTDNICKLRVNVSLDFNKLMKLDLRDKIFTRTETGHVFLETFKSLEEKHQSVMRTGEPQIIENWVGDFIKSENLFQSRSLKYAFEDQQIIVNPGEPNNGGWHRKDFDRLVSKSNFLAQDFSIFKSVRDTKLEQINNASELETVAITTANSLTDNYLNINTNNSVKSYQKIRDDKLAELEKTKAKLDFDTYETNKKTIHDEYNKNINETKSYEKQTLTTKNIVKTGGEKFNNQLKNNQKNTIIAEQRHHLLFKFPPLITDIFEDYKNSKDVNLKNRM